MWDDIGWSVNVWATVLPAEPEVGKMTATYELDHFIILNPVFDDEVGVKVDQILNDWLIERVHQEPIE